MQLVCLMQFVCDSFLFMSSTSSTNKPKLPQRIFDAVKSYIYTPEDGKYVFQLHHKELDVKYM